MLAELEEGMLRELRHDFRAIYHVSYDEVPLDEAIDLVLSLPAGSNYVRRKYPEYAWTETHEAIASVQDTLWEITFARAGIKEQPPRITRPRDLVARKKAATSTRKAKDVIESTQWTETTR